jgi:hypothetical membrane protein
MARPRPAWPLVAGVVAPLLFTAVWLVDGATRAGYDPMRHQVSLLSLGDRGWLQVASFLVTGTLLLVFAQGLRTVLAGGDARRVVPGAIAVTGVGLALAGVFSTQPMFGYPPGTPEGLAAVVTLTDALHLLAALLLFAGLFVLPVALARRWWRAGDHAWAMASAVVAGVVFLTFGLSGGGPSGELLVPSASGLLQRVSLVAGMGWVLVLAVRSIREPERI